MLSKENLRELRHNLAHLSLPAVREFYESACGDCRFIYGPVPSPRQMQILVQVWKQLWEVALGSNFPMVPALRSHGGMSL
jgi:hypothetical protein